MLNMQTLMKQAQAMQQKMMVEQEKLKQQEFGGSAAGNMVSVIINGEFELKKINIDKSLMVADEVDILEDLIMAAFNDAKGKVDATTKDSLGAMTGGMKLPF